MWISDKEGAKFWLNVFTELKNRSVNDILIACVDGLKGFPEASNTIFPQAQLQSALRNSMKYVLWKDYKAVTDDLKQLYQSITEEEALLELNNLC